MYTMVRRVLSGGYGILDPHKNEIVASVDKQDFKRQLRWFINQEKEIQKKPSNALRAFYNEDDGTIVFGRKRYTKSGQIDKRAIANVFLRPERDIEKAKELLEELGNENHE